MNNFDIPLFKKIYDLYKTFCGYRTLLPKAYRYTVAERAESCILEVLESAQLAGYATDKREKMTRLEWASARLNLLRIFFRLMKDIKALDTKKYLILETNVDEIGRMLGGWIRSTATR